MTLHLVRAGELLGADYAWKDLSRRSLVVEEGVTLEAVLVLEVLLYLHPLALDAPVGSV